MYAGVDIGASTTEVVLINKEREITAYNIWITGVSHQQVWEKALNDACKKAACDVDDLNCIVSTGYGRKNIKKASYQVTEITCHARGAAYYFQEVRTILDIGGQDSKVIKIDEDGNVVDFIMNEKCAAGTGRFLETMAKTLEVKLEEMGELSSQSSEEVRLSSVCTVFAESEAISKIAEGKKLADIINGIHHSVCDRAMAMLDKIGIEPLLVVTGGIAKNRGIVSILEKSVAGKVYVPEEPQITGALGAALIALEKANQRTK